MLMSVEAQNIRGINSKTAFVYGARGPTFISGWPYYFAKALQTYGRERNTFSVVDVAPQTNEGGPNHVCPLVFGVANRANLAVFVVEKVPQCKPSEFGGFGFNTSLLHRVYAMRP